MVFNNRFVFLNDESNNWAYISFEKIFDIKPYTIANAFGRKGVIIETIKDKYLFDFRKRKADEVISTLKEDANLNRFKIIERR